MADKTTLGRELLVNLEEEAKSRAIEYLSRSNLLTADQRDDLANGLAKHLADFMAISWGGQQVYIPKDQQRRAAMIYEDWDGFNQSELVKKYGLCLQTIYKIIKREREARSIRQGSLLEL